MSIIYDALKKVEKNVEAPSNLNAAVRPEGKNRFSLKTGFLFVLVAFIGLFAANFLFDFFAKQAHRTPKTYPQPAAALPVRKIEAAAQTTVSVPASASPRVATPEPAPLSDKEQLQAESPSLTLNGVFFSDDGGYALINNQIVKEGDAVEGLKVVRITAAGVELDKNGSVIKLSTPK